MHANEALIRRFYERFAARDAAGMRACYHPDVVFSDPAFGELRGPRAGDMWEMLTGRAADLEVTLVSADADDQRGRARWEARYTFTGTGRPVHNLIDAEFRFRDGLIARHDDTFDLRRWGKMALGPLGWVLGLTPLLAKKVRGTAVGGLDAYVRRRDSRQAASASS